MKQVSGTIIARANQARSAVRGRALCAGLGVLIASIGAAGCVGAPTSSEEEPINSVSQEDRDWGYNGISPELLIKNYLIRPRTDQAHVTSPVDPNLVKLCDEFDGTKCKLKAEWANWLNPNHTDPPDAETQDRYVLLTTMVQCNISPDVVVQVPGFGEIWGMFSTLANWTESPLDTSAQELLSGCIASKVNAFGQTVPIGLVGPGPGTEASQPVENELFRYQEAAYCGTLFGYSPAIVACTGNGDDEGLPAEGQESRICSKAGNPCHIKGLGMCSNLCSGWGNVGIPSGEYCTSIKIPGSKPCTHPFTVYMRVIE